MFCSSCGNKMSDTSAKFCQKCGTATSNSGGTPPQSAASSDDLGMLLISSTGGAYKSRPTDWLFVVGVCIGLVVIGTVLLIVIEPITFIVGLTLVRIPLGLVIFVICIISAVTYIGNNVAYLIKYRKTEIFVHEKGVKGIAEAAGSRLFDDLTPFQFGYDRISSVDVTPDYITFNVSGKNYLTMVSNTHELANIINTKLMK